MKSVNAITGKMSQAFLIVMVLCSSCMAQAVQQRVAIQDQLQKNFEKQREMLLANSSPTAPKTLARLLRDTKVAGELGFDTNDMRKKLAPLQQEESNLSKERMKLFNEVNRADPKAMQAYSEQVKELEAKLEVRRKEMLEEILTPEEYKRLREISIRTQIQQYGLPDMLMYSELREKLSLSDRQLDILFDSAADFEKEREEKRKAIEDEFDRKILDLLSVPQQKKLQDEVGKYYQIAPPRRYSPFQSLRSSYERIRAEQAKLDKKPK